MKLFFVTFALLSFLRAATAMAVAVAFYSGTFDPPTQGQLRMIRCALGDFGSHRACEALGKQISRLVVLVNDDIENDTLASSRERVLMLGKELQKYGNRVEIVAATSAQAEASKRALLADKNIDQLFQLVSGDSTKGLRQSPGNDDRKIVWVTFPLEKERGGFKASAEANHSVGSGVMQVMEQLGLYQDISEDLAELQRSSFEEGWKDFLEDLKLACPTTISHNGCAELASDWEAIPIVTTNDARRETYRKMASGKSPLIYTPSQSEDRWAEKFVETALQFVRGSQDYNELKTVADDMAARVLQGYPYGKLPHLRRVSVKEDTSSLKFLKVREKPVTCSTPDGSYYADMDEYLADRFPKAFSTFLKKGAARRSNLPVELYVHNHPVEAAYAFHRRDGYSTFYFLQTRRGQLHRNIYLAIKSQPRAYRLVLTNVRGNDRQANVLCQIQRTNIFSHYHWVESQRPEPLFVFNSEGNSLKLDPKDVLLFGFKGNWTRRLLAHNWRRQPLVREGLDIDLLTHSTIKHKLVVARNVYGDDGKIILETFYKKGMRQVLYLGTAGAVADYRVGDVVIPNEFTDPNHNTVPFEKNLARAYQPELANLLNVYADKKHGWVQSLFDETKDLLLDWRARSVVSVDVEGLHLAKFARTHPDLQMAALFVISDETMGETTIEETMAVRGLIDESVDKVMSVVFPKVVNPN
jgi:Phosphorylase superfamily